MSTEGKKQGIVELNVGGTIFETTEMTLMSVESMLSAMLRNPAMQVRDSKGRIFIDRDGRPFAHILNFLRRHQFIAPKGDEFLMKEIAAEAEYFQISELVELFSKPAAEESLLLGSKQLKQIGDWIEWRDATFELIYRGTRDGFESRTFHRLCDGRGATVTIVQAMGYIFGGYTPTPWRSDNFYAPATGHEFLFTFKSPFAVLPQRFPVIATTPHATFGSSSCGPTFGDMIVSNNCDKSPTSACCLSSSFQDPFGQGRLTFTGTANFIVTELEVLLVK